MKKILVALLLSLAIAAPAWAQTAPATTTNRSVTITAGAAFQAVLARNTGRRGLTIQNNKTNTDNCWIAFGSNVTAGTATAAASILLTPGQAYTRYYPYIPLDEIEATCATTADTLYVDTQ